MASSEAVEPADRERRLDRAGAASRLLACWHAGRVGLHMLWGVVQIRIFFPWCSQPQRDRRVQVWARTMLNRLGVELAISGTPRATGPVLLAANHVSWLDIVVLHAVCHCRFVSKADVRKWPVIGTLASGGGTLYVERESRRDAVRVVHEMARALQEGDILVVFPEGTTGDGRSVLPFHANLIQAAIAADAPAQAVALRYVDPRSGEISTAPSYATEDSLLGSIWRTICARKLRAVVGFGAPQRAEGRDRRAWARDLRASIVAMRPR